MILYFDTYISNNPLYINHKAVEINKLIRPKGTIFEEVDKIKIFCYTVDSFIEDDFDKIIINVEFENVNDQLFFNSRKYNSPKFQIRNQRSKTKRDYLQNLEKFNENEWILFSPNNDHPNISNKNNFFNKLEGLANDCIKKYNKNVTIFYSHFTECNNFIENNQYLSSYPGNKTKLIEETNDFYVVEFENIQYSSIQIFQTKFLIELFNQVTDNNAKIIRVEDLGKFSTKKIPTISIIPKFEICRHYDTYVHTIFFYKKPISALNVPPIFIPGGFFNNDIKIKYGYDIPYKGFLNINPNGKKHSFIDTNNGFDVLALLSDLPFFWTDKISILDINPDFIENHSYINHKKYKLINPWGRIYKIDLIVTNILRKLNNGKFYNLYVYILNKFFWKQRLKKLVHD